jgi:glycosyltransferase involved in cell wall biosynthesis
MHVLNIIQCANLGGMEQSTLALLKTLQVRGHTTELLSLNVLGAMGPLLAANGIPAEGLPYLGIGGWRSILRFKNRLAGTRADALIMTGHNLLAMEALGSICGPRRALSIHFHHTGVKPAWQWRLIYRSALRHFSAIMFPTDFIRREAEDICPQIQPICHTIGSPIALSALPSQTERAAARKRLGIPVHAHVVGNAGWLIPRKRFDVFLKVARNIAISDPDALFAIAGDGPEANRLRSSAMQLGIADRVRWLGWQSDLAHFYRSLDLMVFNTDWDALGRSPLEAVAVGVPMVASVLNGGLSEVLDQENYGPVYAEHDIDRLTDAALSILRDLPAAGRLVEAGRRRLAQVASPDRYADQVCGILGISHVCCDGRAA